MRKVYILIGAILISLYAVAEWTGWSMPTNAQKGAVPAGARTSGGYRSYHFWTGGK